MEIVMVIAGKEQASYDADIIGALTCIILRTLASASLGILVFVLEWTPLWLAIQNYNAYVPIKGLFD